MEEDNTQFPVLVDPSPSLPRYIRTLVKLVFDFEF